MSRARGRSRSRGGARRDDGFRRSLAVGVAVSVVLHAVLALLPSVELDLPGHLRPSGEITLVAPPGEEAPPDVEVPSPPARVTWPAEPEFAGVQPVSAGEDEPVFIPHDVPPRLMNSGRVQDYLRLFYPVALRVASVEGSVHLWLFVEGSGRVSKVQVRESSGSTHFDDLARSAVPLMQFSPALNQGRPVGVWVSLRVRFNLEQPPVADDGRLVHGTDRTQP